MSIFQSDVQDRLEDKPEYLPCREFSRANAFENLASEDFFQVCVVPSSSEAFSFDAFFQ